jgi:hypothetical protein
MREDLEFLADLLAGMLLAFVMFGFLRAFGVF